MRLRNPHSVLAVLKKRPEAVRKLVLNSSKPQRTWLEVVQLAESQRISIEIRPKRGFEESMAEVEPRTGEDLQEMIQPGGIYLALDCLQDPRNVGAIFRTAAFFGVKGVLLTEDRSSPLSEIVYDTSAGGMELVPFAILKNLKRGLSEAKEKGLWVLGTSQNADRNLSDISLDRSWVIVMGNEEKGLRRLTEESCDEVIRIPSRGKLDSLNVSVATGIVLSHFSLS